MRACRSSARRMRAKKCLLFVKDGCNFRAHSKSLPFFPFHRTHVELHDFRSFRRQIARHLAPAARCRRARDIRQTTGMLRAQLPRTPAFGQRLTTTDSVPEIGRPDLRGPRTPSDTHPGAFFFSRSQRNSMHARGYPRRERFRSRVFRSAASSANVRTSKSERGSSLSRISAWRRESAAPRCSVRVATGNACAYELPVVRSRQCEASIARFLAVWVSRPSGARGSAVAYVRGDARVFLDDGSSVG